MRKTIDFNFFFVYLLYQNNGTQQDFFQLATD